MEKLYDRHCEACRIDSPSVNDEEATDLLLKIPGWKRGVHEGVEKLTREFYFIDFKDSLAFTCKIAALSEKENHHPSIMTEWGKVTVCWWTHSVNGLHINDFIMAAKTDMIVMVS